MDILQPILLNIVFPDLAKATSSMRLSVWIGNILHKMSILFCAYKIFLKIYYLSHEGYSRELLAHNVFAQQAMN